ncbi:DUF6879 family protein [Streptomyces decoyicus]
MSFPAVRKQVVRGLTRHPLPRNRTPHIGLPDYDFWLLDSRTVVKFSFDDEEHAGRRGHRGSGDSPCPMSDPRRGLALRSANHRISDPAAVHSVTV